MPFNLPTKDSYQTKIDNGQTIFILKYEHPQILVFSEAFRITPPNNKVNLKLISNFINFLRTYLPKLKFISIPKANQTEFIVLDYDYSTIQIEQDTKLLQRLSSPCLKLTPLSSLDLLINDCTGGAKQVNFEHKLFNRLNYYQTLDHQHYFTFLRLYHFGMKLPAFWLSSLANQSHTILFLSVKTQNNNEIRPQINRALQGLQTRANDAHFPLNAIQKTSTLMSFYKQLSNNKESIKAFNLQIMIKASNYQQLVSRCRNLMHKFNHFRFVCVNQFARYDISHLLLPINKHQLLIQAYDLGGSYMFIDSHQNDFSPDSYMSGNSQLSIQSVVPIHFTRPFGEVISLKNRIRVFGSMTLEDLMIILMAVLLIITFNGALPEIAIFIDIFIIMIAGFILYLFHRE